MRAGLAIALVGAHAACSTNLTPQPEPLPTLPACVPDGLAEITADELPIALGATVAYYAGTDRTIDQRAQSGIWNFGEERADDDVIALGPVALRDQWYAASFPAGHFVVDAGGGLAGIYHQDAQALWLDGTASHDEMPAGGKTLIVYPQALAVLRFPIRVGDAFVSSATLANVTINGLPFNGTDELAIEVVDAGELVVPYVEFSPVLRVRTYAERRPSSGGATSRRQTLFLFDCFGEIARAESRPDETNPDFSNAAYVRRFALGVTP